MRWPRRPTRHTRITIITSDFVMDTGRLAALLQLSSPALPIGGYSYSQGMEAAIEQRLVTDEASAASWIRQQLECVLMRCEAPLWLVLYDGWQQGDGAAIAYWNQWFLASRETQELRQETVQMGWSLVKLAGELVWGSDVARDHLQSLDTVIYPTAHAYAAWALGLGRRAGLTAYLYSWLENQMMAALKAAPLGQVAGQRIVQHVRPLMAAVCDFAVESAAASPPRISTLAPQLAILSSRHETQYSRLFRS